jgi:hypothetical protein
VPTAPHHCLACRTSLDSGTILHLRGRLFSAYIAIRLAIRPVSQRQMTDPSIVAQGDDAVYDAIGAAPRKCYAQRDKTATPGPIRDIIA